MSGLVLVGTLVAFEQFPHRILGLLTTDFWRVQGVFVGPCRLQEVAQRKVVVPETQVGIGYLRARRIFADKARYGLQRERRPLLTGRRLVSLPQRDGHPIGSVVGPRASLIFYLLKQFVRLFVVASL